MNYVSIKLLKATCGISWQLEKNKQDREIETGLQSLGSALCVPLSPELKHLGNGSSLPVLEGDSLRLACNTDSNPPATLSWSQGSRTLSPSHPSSPGVLYLPRVESGHEGELTCRAQHPRGSLWISVHLSVQSELRGGRGEENPPGRGHSGAGRGQTPLTLLPPCSTPAAAGPLLLPGGRGSALQLLLPSPTSPLSALAAGRGAAGGGAQQHQQRLLRGRLQLRRALDQWLPEPPRGAQLRPQPQLRGPERPRGPERVCPAAARSGVC